MTLMVIWSYDHMITDHMILADSGGRRLTPTPHHGIDSLAVAGRLVRLYKCKTYAIPRPNGRNQKLRYNTRYVTRLPNGNYL